MIPRIERTKHHKLLDILAIAICAVLSGADYWTDIEAYAQEKKVWLKNFLELPHGIPSNEITVVPKLLNSLLLKGAIVTLDAMGCQRRIARQIKAQEADYVLAVKENQGCLHQSLQKTFLKAEAQQFNAMTYSHHETIEGDHGRIETRCYTVLPLMYLHQFKCR